jgi:hypothetical protein
MATDFAMPAGGEIKIVNHISNASGLGASGSKAITAALSYDATSILNITTATYDATAQTLTWTGNVASDVTVPQAANFKLVVTNNVASSSFTIDYDSASKPSRIDLPTSTVIEVVDVDGNAGNGIQEVGFYSDSFANGGTLITTGTVNAGEAPYVRVKVSDPFGDYDINGLDLVIDGPESDK